MTALEHLREAEKWAERAAGCYDSGSEGEVPAAGVCASIGQLHVGLAAMVMTLDVAGRLPVEGGGSDG